MKSNTPLLKTLLVAAATSLSFYATPTWAEDVTLGSADDNTNYHVESFTESSTVTLPTANYTLLEGTTEGWLFVKSSTNGNNALGSIKTISFAEGTTFSGEGLFGIVYRQGQSAQAPTTIDLTNVDASGLTGQFTVVDNYAQPAITRISGDTWSKVEYVFGDTESQDSASPSDYTLTFAGATTLAGISGANASSTYGSANKETITVETAGTTITLAGTGTYEYDGALATSEARASLIMNSTTSENVAGNGKQTFGGTNYLQNVTVTAGTLALGGTTDISGTVSVGTSGTLELGGTITLGSAITNAGSIVIEDGTTFVLDNLTQNYDSGSGNGYCQLIVGDGSTSVSYTGSISFSYDGNTIDWNLYVDQSSGNVYAYGTVGALTWAGDSNSNSWNYTDSNWVVEGSTTKTQFIEGDSATFGAGGYSTVNITESLKVGSISVEDDYIFTTTNQTTDGVVVDTGKALTVAEGKTLTIDKGVTLYIDFVETSFSVDGTINGSGTIELDLDTSYSATINLGDGSTFTGTVYIHSGDFTLNNSNIGNGTYELAGSVNMQVTANTNITVANDIIIDGATDLHCNTNGGASSLTLTGSLTGKGTLTLAAGSGNALTISGDVDLGGLTIKTGATVTLTTYTDSGVTTGTNQKIGTVTFSSAGTLAIGDGVTLTVGTVTGSTAGSTISIGEGSVLNVTNGITYSTGNAASTASKITGAGADTSTVITGSLQIGSGNGASVQISDVTFITGGISYGSNSNLNFYLFFKDATLGFTESTTISPASSGGYGFMLGEFNGFSTTTNASTTTINTSKYDTTTNKFSDTDGVNVTIGANITGTYATLAVEGNGSLTLSGTTQVSGLTLSSGELNIAGTTSVSSGLTVSGGTLSVSEDGSLNLSGTISLATSIENSGTITIADGTSFVIDGMEMSTKGNDGTNYYVIIDGSSGTGSVSFSGSISDFTLSSGESLDGWSVYVDDGYLVIHNGVPPQELTWAGTDNGHEWNATQSNTIWTNADGDSVAFSTDSNVTFDDTAENKSVVLGDNIEAGTITVTGTGYELSGEYKLTATEFVLADTNEGEHTFTIAKGTTVEVGSFTENVGQMNLVVNGDLKVDGDMHVDASADEVISGSGTFYVRDFTYDAEQGSSLTISVADASFTTLYEQPSSESDDNNGDYRRLIIGSEEGAIPDGKNYSTEVWVGDGLTLAGKSELRVNENSYLYTTSLTDSSDCDTLISGKGTLEAAYVTFGGKGEVTISIATFDVGNITFSNEGKLTISSDCFWAYTAVFSNSGEITITKGANVFIGETTSTVNHTITVEEDATFSVGSLDRTQNKLDLVVNGTMNVVKDLSFGEYEENTSGLLSFGDSTDSSKTSYAQTLSGTGTVNVYGIEDNLSSGKVTISVANLNIGKGGITEYGNSGIHIAGTTIGLYDTDTLELNVPLVIDSAGAKFNPTSGQSLTISGVLSGTGAIEKIGEGTLKLSGENTLTGGVTISKGVLEAANSSALGTGTISIEGGQLSIDQGITISNTVNVTFSEAYQVVSSTDTNGFYAIAGAGKLTNDSGGVEITLFLDEAMMATLISQGELYFALMGTDVQSTYENDFSISLSEALSSYDYEYYTDSGVVRIFAIPEPSMFGLLFGFASVGLVATRRRRRKAA